MGPIELGKIYEVTFLRLRQLAGQPCCIWEKESSQGESHCSDISLEKISHQTRMKCEQRTAVHWTEEVEISDKGSWVWDVKHQRRASGVLHACLWLRAGLNMCKAGPPEVDQRAATMSLIARGDGRDSAQRRMVSEDLEFQPHQNGEILFSYSQPWTI